MATSPQFLGHDGLNYLNEIRRIGERAGLEIPRAPTLAEIIAGASDRDDAHGEDPLWCPVPGDSDLDAIRELRERLCEALFGDQGADVCSRLTLIALDYSLIPALNSDGCLTVHTNRGDVAGRFASRLVPAAMALVSERLLARIRFCADLWCRSPFLDRTRNGSAMCCSARCSARLRKRRFRAGESRAAEGRAHEEGISA